MQASDDIVASVEENGGQKKRCVARGIASIAHIFDHRNGWLAVASVVNCLGRSQRLGPQFVELLLEETTRLRRALPASPLPSFGVVALNFVIMRRMPVARSAALAAAFWRELLAATVEGTYQRLLFVSVSACAACEGWPWSEFREKCRIIGSAVPRLFAEKAETLEVEAHRKILHVMREECFGEDRGGELCEEVVAEISRNVESGYPSKESFQRK